MAASGAESPAVLEAVRELSSITKHLLDNRGTSIDDEQRQMLRRSFDESLKLVAEAAKPAPQMNQLSMVKELVGLMREL